MQAIQINPRVSSDDAKVLDGLGGSIFSRNQIATMLLHAAIEAVRDNPDALKFPPAFSVTDPPSGNELNQKSKPKK